MANLALSGIASGLDTDTMISRIMSVERQRLAKAKLRDSAVEGRSSGLKEVESRLKSLRDAAAALRQPGLWADVQTVSSSDKDRVAVNRTGMVPAGGYSVDVRQLAAAQRTGFTYTASAEASAITVDGQEIAVEAGAKPADIATLINNRKDISVYATALDETTIVFSARKTGTAGAFSVSGTQLAPQATHTQAARDAEYSLDGGVTWQTSSTHQIENAIPGLTLTLKGVTTTSVTINAEVAALDKQAVKDKLNAFIGAYNELVTTTRAKLDEKTFKNPQTDAQAARGRLFGDTGLNAMLSGLRRAMTDQVASMAGTPALDELMELGISTGKASSSGTPTTAAKQGKLTLDTEKLDAALADPGAVRRLLGGETGVEGFAQRIEALVAKEAGTGGVIDERLKVATAERERITDANRAIEDRIAAKEKRLRAQFAAMETALGKAQSQQGWLSAQMSAFT